ncbi:MAG: RNA-directed DNA polymerase [Candidatus Thiodubiliella endoseptemdiera]|uniref:RNA-directed DNA polymerase n=1 Tax=Candidatus Thiodubiliella endoseptemdiera TaxID=2738886 RepID=A0A853F3I9_9GAMM|nr:RNA-directed DNA polymerase [Candidatus Thiodubiliella endoseptemdiera]
MAKNILQLDYKKARDFLLQKESYSTIKFPPYIKFDPLINAISAELKTNPEVYKEKKEKNIYPSRYEDVNYKLFNNKNGKYSWRLLQLIHPVLYVDLVHEITKESNWSEILLAFRGFQENKEIVCASIPIVSLKGDSTKEQISAWSKQVEQKSIELGLEYDYIFHTDIVDCYGAIYTHSIPWAIHTKTVAKKEHANTLIGNKIDTLLRSMNYGQTNGIPQGSVLMDFIAEMVLGYIDECLSNCLDNSMDYHIIRYRDDYRIFVNNSKDGDTIIRELSKILSELGMRLNDEKTIFSDDVVNSSIKPDKLHQIVNNYQNHTDVKKQLLVIKNLADNYPNSGALNVALNNFR